jgi:hypothetical protein
MKKLSQRSLLLFGVMLVVCALVPSMASAASWFQVGTTHQLFSPNLQFTAHMSPFPGEVGWQCNASEFEADVVSTMGTNFPWTATATSTTDIQIHRISVDILFENTPGNPSACPALGAKSLLTGTLRGGSWNPVSNEVFLVNETGVTDHFVGLGGPSFSELTVTGTFRDTTGTLRMFD